MVEVHVRHDGHPAVPGVRRVQPPAQTDLDERDIRPHLGEAREDDGGQQLELGRLAVAPRHAVGDRQDALDETGEVVGGDRPSVDLDALAVGDEVWLRGGPDPVARRAQGRLRDGEDAALAVGARR